MSEDFVVQTDGRVRYVTLHRPRTRNSLSPELARDMTDLIVELENDDDVRVGVIAGSEGAFCSGLQLEPSVMTEGPDAAEKALREFFNPLIRAIDESSKPIIAFVDGPAAGFGASLALACDFRIGTERASFTFTFSRLGLIPDGGATWLLPRAVGLGKALELFLLTDRAGSDEALRIGLLQRVVASSEAQHFVASIAARLAAGAPLAYSRIKQLARQGLDTTLSEALEAEIGDQSESFQTKDFQRGIVAFLNKEPPVFEGD